MYFCFGGKKKEILVFFFNELWILRKYNFDLYKCIKY